MDMRLLKVRMKKETHELLSGDSSKIVLVRWDIKTSPLPVVRWKDYRMAATAMLVMSHVCSLRSSSTLIMSGGRRVPIGVIRCDFVAVIFAFAICIQKARLVPTYKSFFQIAGS